MNKTLTAVLFVGGLSRRMGVDKATMQFEGEPLWARQLHELRQLEPDTLWISARSRPAWCPPEIEVIVDEPPSLGPLSGLAAALRRLQTSHLLALAVDLPRMKVDLLRKLWSLAQPGCGVVPTTDLLEPLCAIYPVEAAIDAATTLKNVQSASMQSFVRAMCRDGRMQTYPCTESERHFFCNINRPEDLKTCTSVTS